ncbi:hypothetical protein [Lactococcus protaetiae]|uniref:Uncharacterized protein n=1 Tax=Lactococcus protaetiae TaxID=2592653 RepID=A0A514Z6F3_9LACT|nr:hypothetical protein [Lactococcus protaetiae]QDK70174.1 hypothetical protein FLP15_01995 [Lactococcus protaetiae]
MVSDILEIIFEGLELLIYGIIELLISIFWWTISILKWLITRVITALLTIVITQHQKECFDFIELSIQALKNHLQR